MLVFDRIIKPRGVYHDYKDGILEQVNRVKFNAPPLKGYSHKPYPIKRKPNMDFSFHPKPYEQEEVKDDFGEKELKHDIVEPEKEIELEKDILKPLLGVPDKEVPDAENPAHYQFKLQGKTAEDISLSNLAQYDTPLDLLKENALTNVSVPEIKKMNRTETLATSRGKFLKMIEKRRRGIVETNTAAEPPRETPVATPQKDKRLKRVRVNPATPLKETIPISEDDEISQAVLAAFEGPYTGDISLLSQRALIKYINEDRISNADIIAYLERNPAAFNLLTISNMKKILTSYSSLPRGLKNKGDYEKALKEKLPKRFVPREVARIDQLTAAKDKND